MDGQAHGLQSYNVVTMRSLQERKQGPSVAITTITRNIGDVNIFHDNFGNRGEREDDEKQQ